MTAGVATGALFGVVRDRFERVDMAHKKMWVVAGALSLTNTA